MVGSKEEVHIGWKSPEIRWVKCNVDKAFKHEVMMSGCGGVLRDHMGKWICGFNRTLDACNSLMAELWTWFYELKLAWRKDTRGYRGRWT